MRRYLIGGVSAGLSAIIFLAGCGVSQKRIESAERRIEVLQEKGVPDSSLSRAKVYLYQAKDSKERGNVGVAKKAADSMEILVAQAEDQYEKDMQRLRPYLDSLSIVFKKARAELSGLHQARLDSMKGIVDSLYNINWMLAAEAKANELVELLSRLKFDQERANEIKGKVPGQWIYRDVVKHSEDKSVHAVEEKIFTFNRDGSATFVEKKKGKTAPTLKMDYEFRSYGDWGLLGDTIHVLVNRFAAVRQNFEDYHKKDGKVWWEKKSEPTYDSAITDGSQNRYITYQDLKADFKKR